MRPHFVGGPFAQFLPEYPAAFLQALTNQICETVCCAQAGSGLLRNGYAALTAFVAEVTTPDKSDEGKLSKQLSI